MKTIITVYSDGWEFLSSKEKRSIPQYVKNHIAETLKERLEGRFAIRVNAVGVKAVNK